MKMDGPMTPTMFDVGKLLINVHLPQTLSGSWGSSNLSFMSFGHASVDICNTSCFNEICRKLLF